MIKALSKEITLGSKLVWQVVVLKVRASETSKATIEGTKLEFKQESSKAMKPDMS